MITAIENNNITSLSYLSKASCDGLNHLWSNSCNTKTEWVGGLISTPQQSNLIICLGQQSESMVTSPVVDLYRRSLNIKGTVNKDFIQQEVKLASQDLKQTPDNSGCFYQGKALFLLPEQYISDAIRQVVDDEGDLIIPSEYYLGLFHTHPFRNKLSHLPSLEDLHSFVFGHINQAIEGIATNGLISMLIKTTKTPAYFNNPDRNIFSNNQRLSNAIAFENYCQSLSEDQAYLSVLRDNCNQFGLQLLEGKAVENSQLIPFFRN